MSVSIAIATKRTIESTILKWSIQNFGVNSMLINRISIRHFLLLSAIIVLTLAAVTYLLTRNNLDRLNEHNEVVGAYHQGEVGLYQIIRGLNQAFLTDGSVYSSRIITDGINRFDSALIKLRGLDNRNNSQYSENLLDSTHVLWQPIKQLLGPFLLETKVDSRNIGQLRNYGILNDKLNAIINVFSDAAINVKFKHKREEKSLSHTIVLSISIQVAGTIFFVIFFYYLLARPINKLHKTVRSIVENKGLISEIDIKENTTLLKEYGVDESRENRNEIMSLAVAFKNMSNAIIDDHKKRKKMEMMLRKEKEGMERMAESLKKARDQLLQSEKMASIGQLAAGVAHEINNPIGFVGSNIGTLNKYMEDIGKLLNVYAQVEGQLQNETLSVSIQNMKHEIDFDYIQEDLKGLLEESTDGILRVKKIVQDLKDFSHVDETEWCYADLHQGIDSTLNIVNNEIKYKAEVVKEYGDLPQVECNSSQLNQVFMNFLVNAAHAIEKRGTITIRTGKKDDKLVWVSFSDTGSGIEKEHLKKIFDPFFTTKPIGTGTGLGLSLSYGIIKSHDGWIDVDSELGQGTTFTIWLPVQHTKQALTLDGVA